MELKNQIELENTKAKLRRLELHYEERCNEKAVETYARQLSLRSIKQMINQLTEEIVRYEARHPAAKSVAK